MKKKVSFSVEVGGEYFNAPDSALEINLRTAIKDALVATYAVTWADVNVKEILICDD